MVAGHRSPSFCYLPFLLSPLRPTGRLPLEGGLTVRLPPLRVIGPVPLFGADGPGVIEMLPPWAMRRTPRESYLGAGPALRFLVDAGPPPPDAEPVRARTINFFPFLYLAAL